MAEQDGVIPFFHIKPVYMRKKSEEAGRPIYEDREYVQKLIPGNKTEIPDQPVKPEDIERWPDQYKRFKSKQDPCQEGTPLEQWPMMTPSRVSALKDINVFTVDQLANLADSKLSQVGPDGHDLKQKAQRFLDAAESSSSLDASVKENESLKDRIRELEAENAELKKNQKKKPGRKPRSETA